MYDADHCAWALAQIIANKPLPADFDATQLVGDAVEGYRIYAVSGEHGRDQLHAWIAQPGRERIRQAVFAFRPGAPPPPPKPRTPSRPQEITQFIRVQLAQNAERDAVLRDCFARLAELDAAAETAIRETAMDLLEVSPGDYRSLLAEARKGKADAKPQVIEEVLWLGQPREFRQVLDYADGVAFSVVPLFVQSTVIGSTDALLETERKVQPFLITSRRERLKLDDGLRQYNLALRPSEPPFLLSRWSPEGVRAFLEGHTPDPARVLTQIETVFDHFVEFQSTRGLDPEGKLLSLPALDTRRMVALDVLSTWFMPVWPAVGYPLQTGEKESGKTTCQRLQAALSCMGAHITAGISTAALKRMADQGFCLYFDDIENINDRNFDADKKAIILAGNTRGVTVPMMMDVGGTYQLALMRVFCKKGFTNITGVYDALGTRVLLIPMVRAYDKRKTERDVDTSAWPVSRQELLDDLYALALTQLPHVEQIFKSLDARPLADRERQIWAPILTLAQLCGGDDLRRQMLALALAKRYEKQERQKPDFTVLVLKALLMLNRANPNALVTIDALLDQMAHFAELEREPGENGAPGAWSKSLTTRVGHILRNMRLVVGGPKRTHSQAPRAYTLDVEQLNRLAVSYSLLHE